MSNDQQIIDSNINKEYEYGFVTDIESETIPPGLNEEVIRVISQKKNEPEWLLEWRLKAYRHWTKMKDPDWANINYPGCFNRPHIHPNSLFSGVYYVTAPKNSGNLMVYDPRPGVQMAMPNRKEKKLPPELWREVHYEPVAGRCIMFPAWLWHEVKPNQSNDIRISVSFNFLQR